MRHRWFSAMVVVAAAACSDVTIVGGGGAGEGGAQGSAGGAPSTGGAPPLGGQGGDGGAEAPVCPSAGRCLEENNCLVRAGGTSRCREIECDLPSPCDPIEFTGSGPWALDPPFTLETPEALACVLGALRDGTIGSYTWFSTSTRVQFQSDGRSSAVHVQADRIAVGTRQSSGDLGTLLQTLGPTELREPSYFDGCAALSSGDAIWDCLGAWSLGCR